MENIEPAKDFDEEGPPVKKLRYRKKDLKIACEKGDLDRLKELVAHGVSVDACDKTQKSALMYACINGHNEIVDFLLDHNVSFDAQDFKGRTALIYACEQNLKDIVELLMKHGADVNEKKYYWNNKGNALTHACSKGYKQIVQIFIDYKAELEFEDQIKNTALMYAIESGHKEIIELLLRNNIDINKKNVHNKTGLLIACETSDEDIVKLLVDHGADISSAVDYHEGKSALAVACINNRLDIAKLLISYGSDIFTKDENGRTLLMHATDSGSLQMVKFFIGKGCDVNEQDNDGKTPLMSACSKGNVDVVKLFIKEGADIKKKTFTKQSKRKKSDVNSLKGALSKVAVALALKTEKRGTTALICASSNGDADIVDLLVKRGANVNAMDENEETALFHAVKNNHVKVVQRLVKCGKNVVNFVSESRGGHTALLYACRNGSTQIAEILLANGAKPLLTDDHERSPYLNAVRAGHFEIVKLMMEKYTIDLNNRSVVSNCRTALMVACIEGHDNIVDLLLKHGANPELLCSCNYNALAYCLFQSRTKSIKCFELLVDYGVDLDAPWDHIFRVAIQRCNFEALEILAERRCLIVNGRLAPLCYRESIHSLSRKAMAVLVRLGLFEWNLFSAGFNRRVVIKNAISLGICPGKVRKCDQYCSLLSFVCPRQPKNQETLVRMLDYLYFYPEDYSHLLKLRKRLENPPDYLDFLSKPLTLEKWSFLSVSKAVALAGPPYLRWNRVNALAIPVALKRKLMFGNDKVFD